MEGFASESSIKLVIKTPNQRVKDIEVSCLLEWTVEKLKSHLSTVYPTKPARSSQKIIYSGKLLDDHFVLKDVLQKSEGKHQTVHLVCTPSTSDKSSSRMTTPAANSPSISTPQVPSTPPSGTTAMQGTSQPDGLRHRNHAYAQHPFYNMQFGHPTHFAHVDEANVNTSGHPPPPLHMGGHLPPPGQHYMYPNAQYFGTQNLHYAAQHMAHMHWMQHMAQLMQGHVHNQHGMPSIYPNIPYPQQNIPQHVPQAERPAAAPQVLQAQERRENRAQNRNMVMNANAGGGMMREDDDEENVQRDWLDYVYMFVRISMLLSIFYFYSSAERLILMGLIMFIVWLIQSGMFNLNRAERNRQQEVQANPVNNEVRRPETENEEGTEEDEEVEEDTENESESQGEDETDNVINTNPHPGYFVVCYNFFVTFFTSLVPQAPRPIAQP